MCDVEVVHVGRYLKGNRTQYAYGIYQGYVLEVMMHEWLLASPHRLV